MRRLFSPFLCLSLVCPSEAYLERPLRTLPHVVVFTEQALTQRLASFTLGSTSNPAAVHVISARPRPEPEPFSIPQDFPIDLLSTLYELRGSLHSQQEPIALPRFLSPISAEPLQALYYSNIRKLDEILYEQHASTEVRLLVACATAFLNELRYRPPDERRDSKIVTLLNEIIDAVNKTGELPFKLGLPDLFVTLTLSAAVNESNLPTLEALAHAEQFLPGESKYRVTLYHALHQVLHIQHSLSGSEQIDLELLNDQLIFLKRAMDQGDMPQGLLTHTYTVVAAARMVVRNYLDENHPKFEERLVNMGTGETRRWLTVVLETIEGFDALQVAEHEQRMDPAKLEYFGQSHTFSYASSVLTIAHPSKTPEAWLYEKLSIGKEYPSLAAMEALMHLIAKLRGAAELKDFQEYIRNFPHHFTREHAQQLIEAMNAEDSIVWFWAYQAWNVIAREPAAEEIESAHITLLTRRVATAEGKEQIDYLQALEHAARGMARDHFSASHIEEMIHVLDKQKPAENRLAAMRAFIPAIQSRRAMPQLPYYTLVLNDLLNDHDPRIRRLAAQGLGRVVGERKISLNDVVVSRLELQEIGFYDHGSAPHLAADFAQGVLDVLPSYQVKEFPGAGLLHQSVAAESMSLDDIAKHFGLASMAFLRSQGRTRIFEGTLASGSKRWVAIKIQKAYEEIELFEREAHLLAWTARYGKSVGLQSAYPTVYMDARGNPVLSRVTLEGASVTALAYAADSLDYFEYVSESAMSNDRYWTALRKGIHDLFVFAQHGIFHAALIDAFHDAGQSRPRNDKGRFLWIMELFREDTTRPGVGAMEGFLEAVRYLNLRASGLADLADMMTLKEFQSTISSSRFAALRSLDPDRRSKLFVTAMLGEYLLSAVLATAPRMIAEDEARVARGQSHLYLDESKLLEYADHLKEIYVTAVQSFSGMSFEDAWRLVAKTGDFTRLARQMAFFMTTAYVPFVRPGQTQPFPVGIYAEGMNVKHGRTRLSTWDDEHGFLDAPFSKRRGLGVADGAFPIQEAIKINFLLTTQVLIGHSREGHDSLTRNSFLPPLRLSRRLAGSIGGKILLGMALWVAHLMPHDAALKDRRLGVAA